MNPVAISLAALAVSTVSASFTGYVLFHDRPRIKTKSVFHSGWEGTEPSVSVSIVNVGRRPIVLRLWRAEDLQGNSAGTYLKHPEGITLTERGRYDMRLRKTDLIVTTPGDDVLVRSLCFEDTTDRVLEIQDIRKNLARLWDA